MLHAAEVEFTAKGFEGASTRDIAAKAGVAQALIHYHFNSKRALFLAMVQRRADISCVAWETALAQVPSPDLDAILEAIFRPALEDVRGAAAQFAVRMMLAKGPPEDQELLTQLFDPTSVMFIEAIRLAHPGLQAAEAANGYRFTLGVLGSILSASTRKGRMMGLMRDDTHETNVAEAVKFCAAGIRALATLDDA